MALAPLGFTVDTSPVAKAVADLERLTSATTQAEAGTKGISTATTTAAASVRQHGSATAAAAAQINASTAALRANGAALMMTAQQSGAAQQQMRNLAFQFQDIGTMLVAGQSPFMLLAQQLPQVTMYGGQLTGVMGALKQTLAGLFSPLGLLTTGFVLAGSAAVSYFMDAGEEAAVAADALAEQADLIQRVADKWGDAIPALREYAAAMDAARDAAELQQASQIIQNSYLDQLRALLPQLNAELSRFGAEAASGGWGSALEQDATAVADAFDEVFDALQAAAQAVAEGEDATDELRAANEALSNLLNSDAIPAVGGMTEAVNALSSAYAIATAAAQELNRQQAIAAAQEANRGRMDKTGQRLGQGADPLSPNEFMSRFGWEEVIDFPRERTARTRRPRKTDAERAAERYDDMLRKSEQFIAAQMLERDALFMTEEAANALRYEQELLNQAANDNIALTPAMAAELKNYAQTMAATEAETVRLQEALDFARDLTGGFFDDFRRGLEQGKGFWESFGNAALNALDKIVDKLLNDVLDALFQVNKAGSGGGGGIFGFLGSLFGGGGGRLTNLPLGIGLYSQGGYTGPGGVNDVAGLVHKGEVVWSQDDIRRAGGVTSVEAMRRGAMPRMQAPANANGGGGSINADIRVWVDQNGNWQAAVQNIADGRVAAGISEYDQTMPERIGGQMNQARRIGAI